MMILCLSEKNLWVVKDCELWLYNHQKTASFKMLNIIWPTPSNSLAKPIQSCPFAPWRWATISTRLAIPEHFCLCSQQSLLCSWLMPPGASCCHWAEWDLSGKLQGKWSVTQSLADHCQWPIMGPNNFRWVFCGPWASRGLLDFVILAHGYLSAVSLGG